MIRLASLLFLVASGAAHAALEVSAWAPPAHAPATLPTLVAGPDGALHAGWIERDGETYRLRHAADAGRGFDAAHTIASGTRWVVNRAEIPGLAATRSGLYAFWLEKRDEESHAYGLRVVHSSDGKRWSRPVVPHDDSAVEHGMGAFWADEGGVGLAWLDGRAMVVNGAVGPQTSTMALRSVQLDDQLAARDELVLDASTCECCQVDAAVAAHGPVLAFRDRDALEVRDVAVVRRVDGKWQAPVPVFADGWVMTACPVNGPAIAARGDDVYVAWYTGAGGVSRVRLAWSRDGGATFAPPIDLAEGDTLGRVDVAVGADGYVWATWLIESRAVQRLMIGRWDATLARGKARVLEELPGGRSTGFPRMAVRDGAAHLLWAATGDDGRPTIAGARVSVK